MSKYIGLSFDDLDDSNMQIVVNNAGEAIPAAGLAKRVREAFETGDVSTLQSLQSTVPNIVFVRQDGWLLGTHFRFEDVAYAMWKDEWVGYCRYPDAIVEDIMNYIPTSF